MIEDPELLRLFKAESEEHLARLDDGLLRLEKTPADPALLEEVFRESHSLKGAARMLGLARVETAAHGLESIFNAARKGETPLTPDAIEHMNTALVDLRQRVQEALADEPNPSQPPLIRGGAESAGEDRIDVNSLPPLVPARNTPEGSPQLRDTPSTIGDGADSALPLTAEGSLRSSEAPTGVLLASARGSWRGFEPSEQPVENPEQPAPPSLPPQEGTEKGVALPPNKGIATAPFRIETVRVETRKLDDLLTQAGELSVIQGRTQHRLVLMEELLERWTALGRSRRNRNGISGASKEDVAHFDGLLKQARNALFDDCARLESTVNRIEDQVRNIRLLPLSTVFALFPRMVRDLAKEQGKEAELILEGGDITVDKRILEEMKDPLMHLLRNAIDHGIESPAERAKLGKPRGGTVRLCAMRKNASILLEVSDDGRGLDTAAIKQVLKKRGLHDEAALAAMTPAQLQQTIFMPGFSTSGYVTELSGRGVGLDVVQVNVERLKGNIHMESVPGIGLTMQLRLPLSLATTRILLAGVADQLFGLPVEFVHTSRRVREADLFTLEGRLAVLLDGHPVIAARLTDLLELPQGKRSASPGILACVVLQAGDERLGLLVDELLSEEEVVPKPLGPVLRRVRNVSSLTMLGNGEICAVLNPADLLRTAHKTGAGLRGKEPETQTEIAKPVILLVEDSALIRAMEKRILEDNGYEVVTAVDGADGLNTLGSRSFAAVVSDIMMPNMNGLDLTAHIRAEPRYKELPVILVTTLASDEDKKRGLDAGANAYLPKPSFDQRVLLDTLKRLIVI
jgi:two-component system chemotaxis sensor kinase CheA